MIHFCKVVISYTDSYMNDITSGYGVIIPANWQELLIEMGTLIYSPQQNEDEYTKLAEKLLEI
jgi:hypothetical protein